MADASMYGSFVSSTNVWDLAQLQDVEVNSPAFKEILVRLYQNVNNIALSLNTRDAGYYNTQEFVNGQLFFPNPSATAGTNQAQQFRQVYRKVIYYNTGLPNTGTVNIPHNLFQPDGVTAAPNAQWTFTRIYGVANDPTNVVFLPLPYASPTLANNIEVLVNNTNIVVTTGSNRTSFTKNYFVLEYLKF